MLITRSPKPPHFLLLALHPIEFISDDGIKIYFCNFYILVGWSEKAPQHRHVLIILGESCENGMK